MGERGYGEIARSYLERAFARGLAQLSVAIPAEIRGDGLHFKAFGQDCVVTREEIVLGGERDTGA